MSFSEIQAEHRRISILAVLSQAPEFTANDSILHSTLVFDLRQPCARDQVKGDLAWLAEQGLVSIESVGHLQVAALTQRGEDVALGRATHPGVKRPGPRS